MNGTPSISRYWPGLHDAPPRSRTRLASLHHRPDLPPTAQEPLPLHPPPPERTAPASFWLSIHERPLASIDTYHRRQGLAAKRVTASSFRSARCHPPDRPTTGTCERPVKHTPVLRRKRNRVVSPSRWPMLARAADAGTYASAHKRAQHRPTWNWRYLTCIARELGTEPTRVPCKLLSSELRSAVHP